MATAIVFLCVSNPINALECGIGLPPVIESLRQPTRRNTRRCITAGVSHPMIRGQPGRTRSGKRWRASPALVFILGETRPLSPKPPLPSSLFRQTKPSEPARLPAVEPHDCNHTVSPPPRREGEAEGGRGGRMRSTYRVRTLLLWHRVFRHGMFFPRKRPPRGCAS